ncbi:ArsR/SmtB family transcription factor [Leadbettera azotonutricia]|uniref:Transcriptional regulator, TrmB n=1 Tax=Leadbettera azotonutricia (strain ATCC BAA-888 / DSM 13862 / ZAS-9) TaxID=545695 RepID=F5YAG0_LEAAZ|nr:helix-turn-helix domain-containing protein [Leadbettera azotonutricia]AEF83262.1 transcriptional regulator, TrmB [Leadbettera azotonutricia ZAS-9]
MRKAGQQALVIDSSRDTKALKALASEVRVRILELLQNQELNITEIARRLAIPQSTATTSVLILEDAGLIDSHTANGVKGGQKICSSRYKEFLINFNPSAAPQNDAEAIEVEMPVGLFTSYEVSAPCGLCSRDGIIGYLDVPATFFSPDRAKAALVWFEKGYVEYKFPNNTFSSGKKSLKRIELSMEMSSEVPGTNKKWPSDISVWINEMFIGTWTSPGDFGDRRGKYTPSFWKLEGSQYGLLTTWEVTNEGTFIDRLQVSTITLDDLHIADHHSVKVRIGISARAKHAGGINIFGKGFGDYDQDIILKLYAGEKS